MDSCVDQAGGLGDLDEATLWDGKEENLIRAGSRENGTLK